jgi:3-hydroxyisobutyrate dehydrogenase
VLLECSTIAVSTSRDLHSQARAKGFIFFDAPVSGGTAGAKAGSLTFMVGGERDKFSILEPILKAMGKNIYYAGGDGAGQAAKICNNTMLAMHMLGTCEGLLLGEHLGLDMKTLFEICNHASGQSWSLSHYCPVPGILPDVPASQDYRPGFMGKMMLKDLKLAVNAASNEGLALPMLDKALALYQAYCDAGNAELDFSGIIKMERSK